MARRQSGNCSIVMPGCLQEHRRVIAAEPNRSRTSSSVGSSATARSWSNGSASWIGVSSRGLARPIPTSVMRRAIQRELAASPRAPVEPADIEALRNFGLAQAADIVTRSALV